MLRGRPCCAPAVNAGPAHASASFCTSRRRSLDAMVQVSEGKARIPGLQSAARAAAGPCAPPGAHITLLELGGGALATAGALGSHASWSMTAAAALAATAGGAGPGHWACSIGAAARSLSRQRRHPRTARCRRLVWLPPVRSRVAAVLPACRAATSTTSTRWWAAMCPPRRSRSPPSTA